MLLVPPCNEHSAGAAAAVLERHHHLDKIVKTLAVENVELLLNLLLKCQRQHVAMGEPCFDKAAQRLFFIRDKMDALPDLRLGLAARGNRNRQRHGLDDLLTAEPRKLLSIDVGADVLVGPRVALPADCFLILRGIKARSISEVFLGCALE
jgi:hypothetical protein